MQHFTEMSFDKYGEIIDSYGLCFRHRGDNLRQTRVTLSAISGLLLRYFRQIRDFSTNVGFVFDKTVSS